MVSKHERDLAQIASIRKKLLLVFEKDKLGPRIRMGDTTKFVVRLVAATLDQTIQSTMYYLSDYAGSPGTSKLTYYNVFLDENNFTYVTISHSDLAWVPDADETIHCRVTCVWYTDLTAFNPFPLLSATFTPATLTPSQSQPPSTVNTFPFSSPI